MSARPSPKPWPMKWIVLSILLFIGAYTFITLHYRKPGKAYQPYRDSRQKMTEKRLEEAGYQRIEASLTIPADPQRSAASLGKLAGNQSTFGGLPSDLSETLVDKPRLPENFSSVAAPVSVTGLMPYTFQFVCTVPDKKFVIAEAAVYVRGDDIVIVPTLEKLGGQLLGRSLENPVLVTIPGGPLKAGEYHVRLVGRVGSRQWTVQVH